MSNFRKDIFEILIKDEELRNAIRKGVKSVTFRTMTLSAFGGIAFGTFASQKQIKNPTDQLILFSYGFAVGQYCMKHYKHGRLSLYQGMLGGTFSLIGGVLTSRWLKENEKTKD